MSADPADYYKLMKKHKVSAGDLFCYHEYMVYPLHIKRSTEN